LYSPKHEVSGSNRYIARLQAGKIYNGRLISTRLFAFCGHQNFDFGKFAVTFTVRLFLLPAVLSQNPAQGTTSERLAIPTHSHPSTPCSASNHLHQRPLSYTFILPNKRHQHYLSPQPACSVLRRSTRSRHRTHWRSSTIARIVKVHLAVRGALATRTSKQISPKLSPPTTFLRGKKKGKRTRVGAAYIRPRYSPSTALQHWLRGGLTICGVLRAGSRVWFCRWPLTLSQHARPALTRRQEAHHSGQLARPWDHSEGACGSRADSLSTTYGFLYEYTTVRV